MLGFDAALQDVVGADEIALQTSGPGNSRSAQTEDQMPIFAGNDGGMKLPIFEPPIKSARRECP